MNIGVLGGTFDPIHMGHLIAAEEARTVLDLNEVLFIPAGQPWIKSQRKILPPEHRLAMVHLAIADNKYFKLSTLETDRSGNSYAVDTMEILHRSYGEDTNPFFIIGQDSLEQFHLWKNPGRLLELCRLVVLNRPESSVPDLVNLEKLIPGITQRIIQVRMPEIGISSTEIRDRVAHGKSIRYLVPFSVEKYIIEQRLYR